MNKHNYYFSVVAGEVGAIIAVDHHLKTGDIGYAYTRELTEEDVRAIEEEDRRGLRRRLPQNSSWHLNSNVRTITQVVSITEGLRQHDTFAQFEIKLTLRKLQNAIENRTPIAKSEPHLNKFHLVSGDYTTNLQSAINSGALTSMIRSRYLSRTQKELREILGSISRW